MDCTVHGNLQARTLEWVAFLSPGDLPNPGSEPGSPALQADPLLTELQENVLCVNKNMALQTKNTVFK